MVLESFLKEKRLSHVNRAMITTINAIVDDYHAQGYKLTLRQLYYQLVSKDLISNNKAEYTKLSTLLKNGRMTGLIDWDAIEDRIRVPKVPSYNESVQDAIYWAAYFHRVDRQQNQHNYIEVWAEKDALSGILYDVTSPYHVRLMINRGYSSCTAMYDASKRLLPIIEAGRKCTILYLGDHDPSGEDMVRDVRDRLGEFGITDNLDVRKIALTTEQIETYNPPANSAKITDPRAREYIEKFGGVSWEVDALRPDVLDKLVRSEIEALIDMDKYRKILEIETAQREELFSISEQLKVLEA